MKKEWEKERGTDKKKIFFPVHPMERAWWENALAVIGLPHKSWGVTPTFFFWGLHTLMSAWLYLTFIGLFPSLLLVEMPYGFPSCYYACIYAYRHFCSTSLHIKGSVEYNTYFLQWCWSAWNFFWVHTLIGYWLYSYNKTILYWIDAGDLLNNAVTMSFFFSIQRHF